MAKGCKTCNQKCGKGKAAIQTGDAVMKAMCKILCKVRQEMCEGKHKGKKASSVAEKRARTDPGLKRATRGKTVAVNKQRFVKFDGAPKNWNRMKMSKAALERQLDKVERQIKKKSAQIVATKVGKKAARAWIKFVPILNVASTAYDIYDLASTGVDVYKQFQQARQQLSGDVYRVRPDVAVQGPNGQLEGIYDFKFDGDDWQPGQREMYNEDLRNSGSGKQAEAVNSETCKCDGPKTVPRTG